MSSNNFIHHNNIVDNNIQVLNYYSINVWDDDYPSGGNYWSDYTGTDSDGDGIGEIPYVIDADNQDNYPLMRLTSPIYGDVNADGIVDIFDIGFISAHWYPGPPIGPSSYDAYADINNDLAVDIFDVGIVSAHWGQTY